jgi:PAS domain-containing protein
VDLVESASERISPSDRRRPVLVGKNAALETATGRPREKRWASTLIRDRPAGTARRCSAEVAETLRGRRQRHELRYLDGNGVPRTGAMLTAPVVEGANVVGLLGIVRDVSEEKLRVEQLVQQEKLRRSASS